jgi:Neuraminidase (sialidase)
MYIHDTITVCYYSLYIGKYPVLALAAIEGIALATEGFAGKRTCSTACTYRSTTSALLHAYSTARTSTKLIHIASLNVHAISWTFKSVCHNHNQLTSTIIG